MISLINGRVQNAQSANITPLGYLELTLNVDATVIASPFGQVMAGIPIKIYFDANCNVITTGGVNQIWSNLELNPQQSPTLLGTWYTVNFYDANNCRVNQNPLTWIFPNTAGSTVDIGGIVATNVPGIVYYPVLGGGGSGGATFSTVGGAYFWGPGVIMPWSWTNIGPSVVARVANQVYVFKFVLQSTWVISKAAWAIGVAGGQTAGVNGYGGIYDFSGNKLVQAGPFTSVLNVLQTSSVSFSPATIGPGTFWLALAVDVLGGGGGTNQQGAVINGVVGGQTGAGTEIANFDYTLVGTAANPLAGGLLPATLGTITALNSNSLNVDAPAIKWEV